MRGHCHEDFHLVLLADLCHAVGEPAEEAVLGAACCPCALDDGLAAGKLLDEIGIHKLQTKVGIKQSPDRNPVHCRALHRHISNAMSFHYKTYVLKLMCKNSVNILKNFARIAQNTKINPNRSLTVIVSNDQFGINYLCARQDHILLSIACKCED